MIAFDIEKSSLDNINRRLEKVIRGLDFSKPMKNSVNMLENEAKRNFDLQGFFYGGWRPLKVSTVKARKRMGLGARPILIVTGKLRRGFKTSVKDKGKVGEIYNTVKYGKYHQTGTRKMAKRQILGLTKANKKAVQQEFVNHIKEILK